MDRCNFKSLTHLHLIGNDIDFVNLILITKNNQLKEISFSLDLSMICFPEQGKFYSKLEKAMYQELNGFSTISTICIDLITISSSLDFLLDSFVNVTRLEIFSLKLLTGSYFFSFDRLLNPFTNLNELLISKSSNILFDLDEIDDIKLKSKNYCLPILTSDISVCNRLRLNGVKRLKTSISSSQKTQAEINNIYADAHFDKKHFESFELNKSSKVLSYSQLFLSN